MLNAISTEMHKSRKVLMLECAALLLLMTPGGGCVPTENSGTASGDVSFLIQISGDGVQSFKGSYTVMLADGNVVTTEVINTAPISYRVKGIQVNCTFQKMAEEPGLLRVVILKEGKIAGQGETESAYGTVWVAAR